jgi:thioredoxin 1
MATVTINRSFNDIIQNDKPVLVDFYADWCGPCRMMPPALDELKQRMGDAVSIIKVNVDKHPDVSRQYNVSSVPTLMVFQKGAVKWRAAGVKSARQLEDIIRQNCP